MYRKILICIIIITISNMNLNSAINNYADYKVTNNVKSDDKADDNTLVFDNTIAFIKKHEGFRKYTYKCIGGYKTNGYGFITEYLPYKYRDSISKANADIVLVSKLKRCLNYANKIYPNLNYYQSLAVAHLGYAKGFGSIRRHALHNMLLEGPINDSTWIYFGKYEVKYKSYRNNRLYELKLFKNEEI